MRQPRDVARAADVSALAKVTAFRAVREGEVFFMRKLAGARVAVFVGLVGCAGTPRVAPAVSAPADAWETPSHAHAFGVPATTPRRGPCEGVSTESCIQMAREGELQTELAMHGAYPGAIYGHVSARFEAACETGDWFACAEVGHMYASGVGVAEDRVRAVELFRRACDGAEPEGCLQLGRAYLDGAGVAPNAAYGLSLLASACEHVNGEACFRLAVQYATGTSVAKSTARAAELFGAACEHGTVIACTRLAALYTRGDGVAKDVERAARLYARACDSGKAYACSDLADLYARGDGIPRDTARARALASQACASGYVTACR
jgi:uncharacterized protein